MSCSKEERTGNGNMNDYWLRAWKARKRQKRACRALEHQLVYQTRKAQQLKGSEPYLIATRLQSSQRVRSILENLKPIKSDTRLLEVGSGAHGLIFFFGAQRGVGVDPLAVQYARLFPAWQRRVVTVSALGETLPFTDSSFDVVLCDNVVNHTERPAVVISEIARVLSPPGLFYFRVYIYHPIYALISSIFGIWKALGMPFEIGDFTSHTTHFTLTSARRLFKNLPFRILQENVYIAESKTRTKKLQLRHFGDRIKLILFKVAVLEIIAALEHN